MKSTWPTAIQRSSFCVQKKAWAKNQSNDTKRMNLPNDWSERDAPLQSFGVKQDSLEEYDGVVNTKWWSVGMIEEHRWRNGHEKKPNENYGRDKKTVVWWVELVILHMVLVNDVQKIVVVPQIQYTAVCDATTNSPKLQVCSGIVDICSKAMEWWMFLSWCRGFFPPFKTKENFLLLSILSFLLSYCFQHWHFKKIVEHFSRLCRQKMFFLRVLSVHEVSAVDLQLFVEIFISKNNILQKSFLMFLIQKNNLIFISHENFLILFYLFFFVIFHG